jgi:PEP-CTERM motif
MKYLGALLLMLSIVAAVPAIAPPVDPPAPAIVPTPGGDPNPNKPNGGPTPPPPNAPEPSSMAIAGVSLVAASAYRLMRRRQAA